VRRLFDGTNERAIIEWRQHDAIDALRYESFNNLNLQFTIVFTQRTLPNYFNLCAGRRQLPSCLDATRMDALPKLVRRAFGNDSDRQLLLPA
jgi:hypothetical protein